MVWLQLGDETPLLCETSLFDTGYGYGESVGGLGQELGLAEKYRF